jgi:hypothetical protein
MRDLQKLMPDRVFDYRVVPDMLLQILPTIHFLHTEATLILLTKVRTSEMNASSFHCMQGGGQEPK